MDKITETGAVKEKLKLYIVRHGETEWNVQKKFQGQLDSPLTEKGIQKIRGTAEELKNIDFKRVYSSRLGRAVKTAQIIMDTNCSEKGRKECGKLESIPELNEIHFGEWQGLSFDEIFKRYPEEAWNYFHNVKDYCAENIRGEELDKGLERFLAGLGKIVKGTAAGNVLIVTHGTVLELFLNYINGEAAKDLDERKLIENGRYEIFTFEDGKYSIYEG